MARIPTYQLVPGMRLARPVSNKNGLVMLGEDTELTEALIDKIRRMDIPGVNVKGVTKTLESKDEVITRLHNRFKNVEGMPYMDMLKRILTEHIEGLYEKHRSENP